MLKSSGPWGHNDHLPAFNRCTTKLARVFIKHFIRPSLAVCSLYYFQIRNACVKLAAVVVPGTARRWHLAENRQRFVPLIFLPRVCADVLVT
jgi:hypothetical protein